MTSFTEFFIKRMLGRSKSGAISTPEEIDPLSRSGYVREAAFASMCLVPNASAIPAILRGLNDWVPEVRRAANRALAAHLRPQFFETWVVNLPTVRRLSNQIRDQHETVIRQIEGYLLAEGLCNFLLSRGATLAPECEALAYRIVAAHEVGRRDELIKYGISASNPQIAKAFLSIFGSKLHEHTQQVDACMQSKFADLRLAAVRAIGQSNLANETDRLTEAFLAGSPAVRSAAWFFLKQRGVRADSLVAQLEQRNGLTSTTYHLVACDFALRGEYQASYEFVEEAVVHTNSIVRAAGMTLFVRDHPECAAQIGERALLDPTRKVRAVTIALARQSLFAMTPEAARVMLGTRPNAHLVAALIQIQRVHSLWDELIFLLSTRATRKKIDPVASDHHEQDWLAKSINMNASPSPAQVAALQALRATMEVPMQFDFVLRTHGINK